MQPGASDTGGSMFNTDHIRTTHVGSLPRPGDIADGLFARERGEGFDPAAFQACLDDAVDAIVARQRAVGIDMPSDGELGKISYATYIKDRLTGFDGDSPRRPPADLADFPDYLKKLAESGGTPTYRSPRCVGPIAIKDREPLDQDIARFLGALDKAGYSAGFMNSASPGVIAQFQPSDFHPDHESYVRDLGAAMRTEYETIAAAGLTLQIDAPDLALGRHVVFARLEDEAFLRVAEMHVEVINEALADVPRERVRLHICWGNYEGPHTHDIPMEKVLPLLLKVKAGALLFETANPRHGHEWRAWRDADLPDDLVLIPGVIDSTTNYVEHPRNVADRILRFADIVGRERVIAGTDCGFATFAGYGVVDPEIVFAKLRSLAEGAAIASEELF